MINQFLLVELENILGKGTKTSKNNYSFKCPFCNHSKKKLEIDLDTDSKGENRFACWVCGRKGRTLRSLLYQMRVPKEMRYSVLKYIKAHSTKDHLPSKEILQLPKEYKPLHNTTPSNVIARKAKNYLLSRGLTEVDILRYNIGYCTSGEYEGKVIIPSYDENNNLNFFIGRTFQDDYFKYKNPSMVKDGVVFFENMINWDLPIVLVEGVFDAMAIRSNAIPMLGKSLPKAILKKLILNGAKEIYIALDQDAKKEALDVSIKLLNTGFVTYLVELSSKDPADMNLHQIYKDLSNAHPLDQGAVIKHKINL